MNKRAQGAIEYLLILGAAILIVAVVVMSMASVSETGKQNLEESGVDSMYDGLLGIKDKHRGIMRVTLSFKSGENELVVPQFYASNLLDDVFPPSDVPVGTIVTIDGVDYTLENDGWKDTGQVELEENLIIVVTAPKDFDLELELVRGEDVELINSDNPRDDSQRIKLISPASTDETSSVSDYNFEFDINNEVTPIISQCALQLTPLYESSVNQIVNVESARISFPFSFSQSINSTSLDHDWILNCSDNSNNLIESVSGTITVSITQDGTLEYPILIKSCAGLQGINSDLDANYKLNNDVDCTGTDFVPIGSESDPFVGSFNGNNKTISDLTIDSPLSHVGLFGFISGKSSNKIYDLSLDTINFVGSSNATAVGGLIGGTDSNDSVIRNIFVSGQIVGGTNTGGIIGEAKKKTLENVSFSGTINGGSNVGGIVGNANSVTASVLSVSSGTRVSGKQYVGGLMGVVNFSKIEKSKSQASINATMGSVDPTPYESSGRAAGGLVGAMSGGSGYWIKESYVLNDTQDGLNGDITFMGGLVGSLQNYVVVENCFARIAIESNGKATGGFIGYSNGSVKTSYSASLISGSATTKNGFFGESQNQLDHISSFFDSNLLVVGTSVGENNIPIYPKTIEEIKNKTSYDGNWDSTIWTICEGQYPELKWYKESC